MAEGVKSTHILVDPFVFTVPVNPSAEDAHLYVISLVRWCRLFRSLREYCSTSAEAMNALWAAGSYPNENLLRKLIGESSDITVNDVRNALRVIAEQQPFLEETIGVSDLVCGPEGSFHPEEYGTRLPECVGSGLLNTCLGACCARAKHWGIERLVFGTSLLIDNAVGALTVRGKVVMWAKSDGTLVELEHSVDEALPIAGHPFLALSFFDVLALYQRPDLATIAAMVRIDSSSLNQMSPDMIKSDDAFVSSIEELGIHKQPSVLSRVFFLAAMAALGRISEVNGAQLHDVRTSRSANSRQVERSDGAKLWRCMVTKEGAGFRLQYWTLDFGGIELQKVTLESEI